MYSAWEVNSFAKIYFVLTSKVTKSKLDCDRPSLVQKKLKLNVATLHALHALAAVCNSDIETCAKLTKKNTEVLNQCQPCFVHCQCVCMSSET